MWMLKVVAAAAAIPFAAAHWNYSMYYIISLAFDIVIDRFTLDNLYHNGQVVGSPYQYIRPTTNSNSPIENVASTDMRCNQGGGSGANTQTYTVNAGDTIGFGIIDVFGHPGPQQVYISKAPSTAASYDGSGDWARMYSLTTKTADANGLTWAADGIKSFQFVIPSDTPSGEYLVRAEAIALHGASKFGGAQFYIGCAQIKVQNGGSRALTPTVKFPGAYTGNEPGILFQLYWPTPTSYTAPGPALWPPGTQEKHSV